MRFSVFLPPAAKAGPVPALYYLAGLTCNEEHLPTKGGALALAAELGLALVACDTSPRLTRFPGDDDSWDFGIGAGFYLDATMEPWAASYRMETHVTRELPAWVEARFPIRQDRRGIFGHSMGGHGALTLALRHPSRYASVSALAPIVAPSRVPWGEKAFSIPRPGSRALGRARRVRARAEGAAPVRAARRPGARRQVPGARAPPRALRGGVPAGRTAPRAPAARRLRPQLLLRRVDDAVAPPPPREGAGGLSVDQYAERSRK